MTATEICEKYQSIGLVFLCLFCYNEDNKYPIQGEDKHELQIYTI